ncbi:ABC transporter ATP-binding protein, partial [Klebsiella pneumoniae]
MLPGVMSPELVDVVETQSAAPEPCIVLIDDAHLVADDSQVLARVLALPDSPLLFNR